MVGINQTHMAKFGSAKSVERENQRIEDAPFVIHPYSNFRYAWDSLTMLVLIINLLIIPLIISFPKFDKNYNSIRPDKSYPKVAMYVKMISDIWFIFDMMINFRTGIVMNTDTDISLNVKRIRTHYLKFWFWLDLISTIPIDLAIELQQYYTGDDKDFSSNNMSSIGRYIKFVRITKMAALLRLMRLSRFYRQFYQLSEYFKFNYDSWVAAFKIVGFAILLLIWCHVSACLQFLIPSLSYHWPFRDCWIVLRELHLDSVPLFSQYSYAFFRALSHMLCIGYGQFPPQSLVDMYTIFSSMLIGAVLFAVFIGVASSMYHSMDCSKRLYKEKYNSVKQYMHFRKLPLRLRRRITDYYENRYQGKMFNEKTVLAELNPILRSKMIQHNCRELVEQCPFFSDADSDFIDQVIQRLNFEMYLQDDDIIKEGTFGRKMYFISRGVVRISARAFVISQVLSDGYFFGEICLLMPNLKRVATVTADTYVYLYSLSVDDFNEVLDAFPLQRQRLMQIAMKRMNEKSSARAAGSIYIPIDGMDTHAGVSDKQPGKVKMAKDSDSD